jgi:hypothetical protein
MRGTTYTDVERLARQRIDERVSCAHRPLPTNERRLPRRQRARIGTAQTLRRLANALDADH